MALIEGFESLSGSPLIPTDQSWSLSADGGLTLAGSASNVTQGAQSYRLSGVASDQFFIFVSGYTVDASATEISLDYTIVSNVTWELRIGFSAGELSASAATSDGETGTSTLVMDASAVAGASGLLFIQLTTEIADVVDVYIDNLRDDTSGSTYTLTSATGSFVLTGNASVFPRTRVMPAATGAYTLTGVAAGLKHGFPITASPASFSLTGTDNILRQGYAMPATAASFTLTGIDVTLTPSGRILQADTASFVLTGNNAVLTHQYKMAASTGSFILTGIDVAFIGSGKILACDTASYILTAPFAGLSTTGTVRPTGGRHIDRHDVVF